MSTISRAFLALFLLWVAPALAANPAFVSGTVNNGVSSTSPMTVTSNGSVTSGDIMVVTILPIGTAAAPTAITPPSGGGWSTGLSTTTIGSSFGAAAVFYKAATVTGSFSGSFTWSGTTSGGLWTFSEWSGGNTTTPLDGAATTSQNASSSSPTTPSITPTAGNTQDTKIAVLFGSAIGVSNAVTKPSALATVKVVAETTTAPLTGVASLALSSAGATGTDTWTLGTAQVTLGVSLLLQPPGSGAACPSMNLLGVGC